MGLVTVGLNENNRASHGRIQMMQPPGGRSNIISEICGPDVAEKSTAKMCHRMTQPPGGTSDILVSDSSSSSSTASSECGEDVGARQDTTPVKKLYRLNSSIVLGDVTAEVNSTVKPKTSIKVLSSDHPLVVDSVAGILPSLKIGNPESVSDSPTPQEVDNPEVAENGVSVSPSPPKESVCDDISTTHQTTNTNGVVAEISATDSARPPSPKKSPSPPPAQETFNISNSSVFGANIPRLARHQPPGGYSTGFW